MGCESSRESADMIRARSVTGPLRRAHPASGATWNVQVVRGKMSTTCLWHACRALSAGLLLMLLGAAMATIGYYADTLSVAQEIRGNATISVKDEARGFHLNNLSYAGPIVMGFGGFIVVAACVMTFEARDSAAKVTPARPQSMPRPVVATSGAARRTTACAPARLDQLGIYRLPHVLPLPHALPLPPLHSRHHRPLPHDPRTTHTRCHHNSTSLRARFGSAPDLHAGHTRATLSVSALRRPLRRYALSVDEPPPTAVSASAAESECGSQSSLALDLHGGGLCGAVTLRVRDNTRRRPLARQQRLHDDLLHTSGETSIHINSIDESPDGDEIEDVNPESTSQKEEIRSQDSVQSPRERSKQIHEDGQHSKEPEETQESSSDTSNDGKTIIAVDSFEVIDEKVNNTGCNEDKDSKVVSTNIDTEQNQCNIGDTSVEVNSDRDPD